MESRLRTEEVAGPYGRARLIVLALAAGVVLYPLIGLLVAGGRVPASPPDNRAFMVFAVFLALAAILLRRTQFTRVRLQTIVETRGIPGLVQHLFRMTVIPAALGEALGVLALVLALLGGGTYEVVVLAAVGLIVILRAYPIRSGWERAVDHFRMYAPNGT